MGEEKVYFFRGCKRNKRSKERVSLPQYVPVYISFETVGSVLEFVGISAARVEAAATTTAMV